MPVPTQNISVLGTMISRVRVSDSVNTLRSISEISLTKILFSTSRSIAARPCSRWAFSTSSSSDRFCSSSLEDLFFSEWRVNGVSARTNATRREYRIITWTESILDVRGRTKLDMTATASAAMAPESSWSHTAAPASWAITAIKTPSHILATIRIKEHDAAVA